MGVSAKERKKKRSKGIIGVRHCMMGAHPGGPCQEWRRSLSTLTKEIRFFFFGKAKNTDWKHTELQMIAWEKQCMSGKLAHVWDEACSPWGKKKWLKSSYGFKISIHTLTHKRLSKPLFSCHFHRFWDCFTFSSKCPGLISAPTLAASSHPFWQRFLKWHRRHNHDSVSALDTRSRLGPDYRLLLRDWFGRLASSLQNIDQKCAFL